MLTFPVAALAALLSAGPAETAPGAPDVPPKTAEPSAGFDFDFLPKAAQTPEELLKDQALEKALETRRTMLQLHQGFGIATMALLTATVVVGQLNYSDKFSGQNTGKFELPHDVLEMTATASFATTGLLALFAPVPVPKATNGTMLIHKASMIVATAGYVAEILLGLVTVSLEGHTGQRDLATAHLICGYATEAAAVTGVSSILFFP